MPKTNKFQVQKTKPKYEEKKPGRNQITFSFVLLLHKNGFDYKDKVLLKHDFYISMIDMLQCNCQKTSEDIAREFTNNKHVHQVKSENGRKQDNFDRLYAIDKLAPDFSGVPRFQLPFNWSDGSKTKQSRLHGFMKNDVFYVRLIDPNHQVYPR